MSSILKALKKLEEDKVLHEEPAGINLSREILKQNSGSRNKNRWLWLVGSSAAVVIITLSAALLHTSISKEAVKPVELPTSSRQQALPALPVEELPVKPQSTGSSKVVSPPAPLSSNEPNRQPAQQRFDQPAAPLQQRETVQPPTHPPTASTPPKTDPVVKAAPLRPQEQTLTLSGIAWNKDSADRLAIINGQPTATGATINGALVEEILPDRVKLSHNGKFFELLIGRDARID